MYRLFPDQTEKDAEIIYQDLEEEGTINIAISDSTLPEQDSTLPTDTLLLIPSINVHTPISTATDYTEALKEGSWLVPDYGTPMNGKTPIIIAAHRFGYIYWDRETRNKISFYNLPNTEIGDEIAIIWDQREFTYEITKVEESTVITDYSADLILYTCKYFNSPIRIFRYAQRTN
jgi:LPXTG-site transpeptidase (sortase) family protein